MEKNNIGLGDKFHFADHKELRSWALNLSADGYGVAIIGYHDIHDNILTITALPEGDNDNE